MKTLEVHYEGRVQGVGFRAMVKSEAHGYDVAGLVSNLPDGRVRLLVSGEDAEVDAFLESIRQGPLAGHIRLETFSETRRPDGLKGFRIDP